MKIILISILFCLVGFQSLAQKPQIQNLAEFDERRFHFGFALGLNRANYQMVNNADYFLATDSLLGVTIDPKMGFNLGIIGSMKITPNLRLRFIPSLSFQERQFKYNYYLPDIDSTISLNESLEATYLEFPLLFKFRTDRVNNFAAFVLLGGKVGLDMQNKADVENEVVLKTQKLDYAIEVGAGTDFFLQYFKLGLELKLALGIPNALIQENNFKSGPIDFLKTRTWMFSITFEG